MDTQTRLINHLKAISGGKINISLKVADDLITIVTTTNAAKQPYVKLFTYSTVHRKWDPVRSIPTTQLAIDTAIKDALQKNPVLECYMFECFNAQGESEGKIYTVNPGLF